MEKKNRSSRATLLQVGDRVLITSYGPFRGLRGTIRMVDSIADELEELFCFYQVVLEGAYLHEPIWFAYHEVELIAPASEASRRSN